MAYPARSIGGTAGFAADGGSDAGRVQRVVPDPTSTTTSPSKTGRSSSCPASTSSARGWSNRSRSARTSSSRRARACSWCGTIRTTGDRWSGRGSWRGEGVGVDLHLILRRDDVSGPAGYAILTAEGVRPRATLTRHSHDHQSEHAVKPEANATVRLSADRQRKTTGSYWNA